MDLLSVHMFVFLARSHYLKTIPTPCAGATRTHTHLFNHNAERKHTHRAHMNMRSGSLRWACLSHSEAPVGTGPRPVTKSRWAHSSSSLLLCISRPYQRSLSVLLPPFFFHLATCYLLPGGTDGRPLHRTNVGVILCKYVKKQDQMSTLFHVIYPCDDIFQHVFTFIGQQL